MTLKVMKGQKGQKILLNKNHRPNCHVNVSFKFKIHCTELTIAIDMTHFKKKNLFFSVR